MFAVAPLPSYAASLDVCQWMDGKRKCGLHEYVKSHAVVKKVEILSFAGKLRVRSYIKQRETQEIEHFLFSLIV